MKEKDKKVFASKSRNVLYAVVAAVLAVVLLTGILALSVVFNSPEAIVKADSFSVNAKSAYLIDYDTGTVLYSKNENARLPVASMVKIMTTLLTLESVDRGELSLDEMVDVSEEAAGMGGSQVFLDAGTKHKAGDLLKTVIVASANDSCVALAERISGSVGGFVNDMNARAKELGMTNTNFVNCTGLPAAESFSSAKDCAIMFNQLIKHPKYFDYSGVWLEDYAHPDGRTTTITNTNKLVRFYKGCDGGKTGFTSEAKFCLTATAKRGDMRLIASVIGADSSKTRFASVSEMFNHAFSNFTNQVLVKTGDSIENSVTVTGGKKDSVELTVERDITQFMARGDKSKFEIKYELPSKLKAPLKAGDAVGKAYLVKDGVVVCEYNVVCKEDVKHRNLFDAIRDIAKRWNT
jgi:D-alanyl-D-alanine carboxypeptidase (penicillin-binding protein 5/6)